VEKGSGNGKGTKYGKGNSKGKVIEATEDEKGKGHGKGKVIVKQGRGGDDISRGVAVQKETYRGDSDRDG